ncbi:MAG: sodium:proton antiporter [Desulfotignum sp.]|nr:sodium:proton antiporter [Desulfotignum sp.]
MKANHLVLAILLMGFLVVPATFSSFSGGLDLSLVQTVHASEPALDSAGHSADEAHAGDHGNGHPDLGKLLPLWACIPFACMLLSIALLPLVAGTFWHHHFGKISAFWAATLAVPFVVVYKGDAIYEILHIILADYVPFIILLWALFTVSGGILLRGTLRGTPVVNTGIILLGTILASWMGTTGAAMLLIRPLLRANDFRKNRTFMVVFFIFLVANVGGSLTPWEIPPVSGVFAWGEFFLDHEHCPPHAAGERDPAGDLFFPGFMVF